MPLLDMILENETPEQAAHRAIEAALYLESEYGSAAAAEAVASYNRAKQADNAVAMTTYAGIVVALEGLRRGRLS